MAYPKNLTSRGCADAAGFQSCQNAVADARSVCLAQADKGHSLLESLAQYCWNRANECEYQTNVAQYLVQCLNTKLPLPYFPTPGNALIPARATWETSSWGSITVFKRAPHAQDAVGNVQKIQGCKCCEASAALSSIYGLCPDTNPSLVGLDQVNTIEKLLGMNFRSCFNRPSPNCCHSDLGFSAVAGGTFFNQPTSTLLNVGGTVTAPDSGRVFTYTKGDGQVYTISAASITAGSGYSNGNEDGNASARVVTSKATSASYKINFSRRFVFIVCIGCFAALV